MEEGYIKFNCEWEKSPPLSRSLLGSLNRGRQEMYQHQLIGRYADGVGYGNISQRSNNGTFIISGTSTGQYSKLGAEHYCVVKKIDVDKNQVWCSGPIAASSETMSHAVIYQECPEVNAVIHIHDADLWKTLIHRVPTVPVIAQYGTPEMAKAIIKLIQTTPVRQREGYFVMAGHEEGLMVFGKDMAQAVARVNCLMECSI